jgi:glycosyltransferase involved in cell wall biosynthesis
MSGTARRALPEPDARNFSRMGLISGTIAYHDRGTVYTHIANGRVASALSKHVDTVLLCAPTVDGPPRSQQDEAIEADNIQLVPQPPYTSSLAALASPLSILRAYVRVCRQCDALVIRGMVPYIGLLYVIAKCFRVRVCHWVIGNHLRLLLTHKRSALPLYVASILYACQDRVLTRLGRWLTNGSFVCSGRELGAVYRSPRTVSTASSTLSEDEFSDRDDCCLGDTIRLLFVGYVRPEKGIEFLLRALTEDSLTKRTELAIVGPWDKFPDYRTKLDEEIEKLGLVDQVTWLGYLPYGPALFERMRSSDIMVLPSLSEGTPHVLLEAMASSLPIVATNVGGIPTCIDHGVHGLLVGPRDPRAIAAGVASIVKDGTLRRRLIAQGSARARSLTVNQFAGLMLDLLSGKSGQEIERQMMEQVELAAATKRG